MRRWLPLIAAAALAGCGEPSAEEAAETADRWVAALKSGDFEAACDLQLESATSAVRARFVEGGEDLDCPAAMEAYAERFSEAKLEALSDLEPQRPIRENRIGVFPTATAYQFEVVLMERSGDAWKLVSIGFLPDA